MKFLYVMSIFLFASLGQAETLKQKLDCQKNLVSSIDRLYEPKGGYFFCDDRATECFLVYENGDAYKVELPKHPTFVLNEIFIEMAERRQDISHNLLTWVEPKGKESVYVDVFWGENKRAFAKEAMEANISKFSESKPIQTDMKNVQVILNGRIENQLVLISNNLLKKSYPPGWDEKKYKESAKNRILSCDWHAKYSDIQKFLK